MKKQMKKTIYIAAFITLTAFSQAQSVGINATGAIPHSSSILDLNTGNTFVSPNAKGFLPPNVPLTGITDAVTVTSPATSLLVYNTATANTGTLAVVPGYYYWDGTKWVALGGSDWHTLGNLGTTAGTNFLGTTDAQDMVFKTNSTENMRILNTNGNVGIGTANPVYGRLSVMGLNDTALSSSVWGTSSGQGMNIAVYNLSQVAGSVAGIRMVT